MNFNLHFGELHSDNSINDKNNFFENYIAKCYKVKRVLISFNCFSEYITKPEGIDYIESFNRNCFKSCSHTLSDPHIDKCVNCVQSVSMYETHVNIDNCCNNQKPGMKQESGTSEQYCAVCNQPSDVEKAILRSELTGVGWSTSYACQDGYTMV